MYDYSDYYLLNPKIGGYYCRVCNKYFVDPKILYKHFEKDHNKIWKILELKNCINFLKT